MELQATLSYELIEDDEGGHPLLVSFSEMAGQMAVHLAAHYLRNRAGGRGILLGTVPGIPAPTVLILGAGTVGRTAARPALANGARVIVLDDDVEKLRTAESASKHCSRSRIPSSEMSWNWQPETASC